MEPKSVPSAGRSAGPDHPHLAALCGPARMPAWRGHDPAALLAAAWPETSESWQPVAASIMLHAMDTMNTDVSETPNAETEAERLDRLAWEAEGIAEARADVAAGRLVDAAQVRAWVDSLRTDKPLPVPYAGR
jgi:predicted transcriptional regulator